MVLRSITRLRKMHPGGTTLHSNASLPMSDSSWRLVQVCFPWRAVMAEASSTFRSRVMDAFISTESRLIPRNVKGVAWSSVLFSLIGALRVEHTWDMASMLFWHTSEPGGPAVKKSSK